eukprot:c24901_g1_i3 orf=315-512(-)
MGAQFNKVVMKPSQQCQGSLDHSDGIMHLLNFKLPCILLLSPFSLCCRIQVSCLSLASLSRYHRS